MLEVVEVSVLLLMSFCLGVLLEEVMGKKGEMFVRGVLLVLCLSILSVLLYGGVFLL